jgi:hypothetical protein
MVDTMIRMTEGKKIPDKVRVLLFRYFFLGLRSRLSSLDCEVPEGGGVFLAGIKS